MTNLTINNKIPFISMVHYAPTFFYLRISQNIKSLKKFLGAPTFGHSVFTVIKIFNNVFTKPFFEILCLTSVNKHNSAGLWPQYKFKSWQ